MSSDFPIGGPALHDPHFIYHSRKQEVPGVVMDREDQSKAPKNDHTPPFDTTQEKRTRLMAGIAAHLAPWTQNDEMKHVKDGMHYMPTANLIELNQQLQNEKTSCQQKALITKTILAQGYLHSWKKKAKKQFIVQPLLLLASLGALGSAFYHEFKNNHDKSLISIVATMGALYLSDRNQQKYFQATEEEHFFFSVLERDTDERQRVNHMHDTLFLPKQKVKD